MSGINTNIGINKMLSLLVITYNIEEQYGFSTDGRGTWRKKERRTTSMRKQYKSFVSDIRKYFLCGQILQNYHQSPCCNDIKSHIKVFLLSECELSLPVFLRWGSPWGYLVFPLLFLFVLSFNTKYSLHIPRLVSHFCCSFRAGCYNVNTWTVLQVSRVNVKLC